MQLRSYWPAPAISILTLLPLPGSMVGPWFGIWALVVLSRSKVQIAFAGNKAEEITRTKEGKWGLLIAVIVIVMGLLMAGLVLLRGLSVCLYFLQSQADSGRTLPPEYRRFWEEPATDK